MKLTRKFTFREKMLLLALMLIVLVAVYYFAVYRPVTDGIDSAETRISDAETQNMILEAKVSKLNDMKKELEIIKERGDTSFIPDYDNLPNVTDFLNSIFFETQNYTLTFGEISLPENSSVGRRSAKISFTAPSYSVVEEKVRELENCSFLTRVSSLTVSRKTSGRNLVISDADVKVSDAIDHGEVTCSITATFFERMTP